MDLAVDMVEERVTWDSPIQFFFTVLGFCVGLGNIWRFPYLCQQNGGGAFVIPFLVMLLTVGMPLLLLELALGQKLRVGAAGAWYKVHPALGGIGYSSSVVAYLVGCYYNVIIAWVIYYLYSSFTDELPWSSCPYNTTLLELNQTVFVQECVDSSETQYFWYRTALDVSSDIGGVGHIKYWMLICLTISWAFVYCIMMKGIASSGKIVYFTALFPYVVLTIFFTRGITLPGAAAGLAHMFWPKMEYLLKPTVWLAAANQVFYSFGLAFGSIISFGSYNNPKKNCVRDVFQITIANAFTAIYACAVIFSILGFKAVQLFETCMKHDIEILSGIHPDFVGKDVDQISQEKYEQIMRSPFQNTSEIQGLKNCSLEKELNSAAQGTGLAFIVMADVFTMIPLSPLWSCLFFLMLLALGLGSQIGILEGVVSMLFDQPRLKRFNKPTLVAVVVILGFLAGLVFTTGAGEYWLTLFDNFGATGLTWIAFAELLSVMYVYGHEKFTNDIEEMTGVRPGWYWQIMWRFVSPALLATIIASSMFNMFTNIPTYSAWSKEQAKSIDMEYSAWSLCFAVALSLGGIIPLVIGFLRHLFMKGQGKAFHRVDTSASTAPMMAGNFSNANFDEFHDLPKGGDDMDGSFSDSDSEDRQDFVAKKMEDNFELKVIDN